MGQEGSSSEGDEWFIGDEGDAERAREAPPAEVFSTYKQPFLAYAFRTILAQYMRVTKQDFGSKQRSHGGAVGHFWVICGQENDLGSPIFINFGECDILLMKMVGVVQFGVGHISSFKFTFMQPSSIFSYSVMQAQPHQVAKLIKNGRMVN
eukprot:359824-Pelagomonas_calceolata.AAC.5